MSMNLLAFFDPDRGAVVVLRESGTEVGLLDPVAAQSFAAEVLAASRGEVTGAEPSVYGGPTCTLTGAPSEDPDDCTTHEHGPA